jgi:hypothetical protein
MGNKTDRYWSNQFVAYAWVVSWFIGGTRLFQLFYTYDWGRGLIRGGLILGICGWVMLPRLLSSKWVPKLHRFKLLDVVAGIATVAGITFHLHLGWTTFQKSYETKQIWLDQGQNSYAAVDLLLKGMNPYGDKAMVDPMEYSLVLSAFAPKRGCVSYSELEMKNRLVAFWNRSPLNVEEMHRLFPEISLNPDCNEVRNSFNTLGYKYGPVLLLSYLPFILAFQQAGIYASHLLCFLFLIWMTWSLSWKFSNRHFFLSCLPFLLLFGNQCLSYGFLSFSAADLLPTVLLLSFVYAFDRRWWRLSSVALGLGFAAKLVPALVAFPILGVNPRRQIFWAALAIILSCGPFLIWNPLGLIRNTVTFSFSRFGDPTALSHFLPGWIGLGLQALFGAYLLGTFWTARKQEWDRLRLLTHLFFSLMMLYLTGKIFHNNYLIWVLPITGLLMLETLLERGSEKSPGLAAEKLK